MTRTPTTHQAPDTSGAHDFKGGHMNPDPYRCVCRFDTDGTTICGVHGDYTITYYADRDER